MVDTSKKETVATKQSSSKKKPTKDYIDAFIKEHEETLRERLLDTKRVYGRLVNFLMFFVILLFSLMIFILVDRNEFFLMAGISVSKILNYLFFSLVLLTVISTIFISQNKSKAMEKQIFSLKLDEDKYQKNQKDIENMYDRISTILKKSYYNTPLTLDKISYVNLKNKEYSIASLEDYITNLKAQNKWKLIIGGMSFFIGLIILVYFIVTKETADNDFINYFISRLTIVLLIEYFSYYFLSMYRDGLNEVKYFQNELTTQSNKLKALEYINNKDINEHAKIIITELMCNDRNLSNGFFNNSKINKKDIINMLKEIIRCFRKN